MSSCSHSCILAKGLVIFFLLEKKNNTQKKRGLFIQCLAHVYFQTVNSGNGLFNALCMYISRQLIQGIVYSMPYYFQTVNSGNCLFNALRMYISRQLIQGIVYSMPCACIFPDS